MGVPYGYGYSYGYQTGGGIAVESYVGEVLALEGDEAVADLELEGDASGNLDLEGFV